MGFGFNEAEKTLSEQVKWLDDVRLLLPLISKVLVRSPLFVRVDPSFSITKNRTQFLR